MAEDLIMRHDQYSNERGVPASEQDTRIYVIWAVSDFKALIY